MTARLRVGFLPLIDAALLVVARGEGFAEQEGLELDLVREASWANLRDRLSVGLLDAAQMLAPAAIAATLGLGHLRAPMAAPAALSLGGASITVSTALYKEMTAAAQGDLADPRVAAAAFARVAAARGTPPVLATVFAYSTHTLLIVEFLRLANLRAETDIPLVVLPPQYTATSLANGQIDGFCAGAPWNAVAVASGAGVIAAFGVDLMPNALEKLLVMRAADIERGAETALALTRATLAAADWAAKPEHRERLARHLARADYVDAPAAMIEAVLAGHIEVGGGRRPRHAPGYLRMDREALRPSADVADRLIEAMIAAGQLADSEATRAAARRVFRDDLFERAQQATR